MKKIKYIALLLCTMFALDGTAQTAKSAYFLDGALYNYQLNPAMKAERGLFSLALGNFSVATNGNVGISDFLYPDGDHLTTFMNGKVDQDEFLGRLPQQVRLGMDFDETLMAIGFRLLGEYTTLALSVHANTSLALPKGFFEFAKKGLQDQHFNFSGINMNTMSYAAATLGYSRELFDGFRLGVNLKYLMGIAYADVTFDKFNIELSEERWYLEGHAQAQAALGSEIFLDNNGNTVDDLQMGPFSPAAKGFAVDLGVVYDMKKLVPGLTLSASLMDLGSINWEYMMSIENNGDNICWEGLTDATIKNVEDAMEDELENIGDKAEKVMEFKVNDIQSGTTKLDATMYLGAEYNMPFYKPLSVAVLYGKRFSTYTGWDEVRGYVNIAPLKWIEASANVGYSTFGTSWGWMLNFHPAGINFFVGSDYMLSKVTPQYLPVNNLNCHATMGISLALGKRK